ncbi:MAG TPA: hypothetical protein VNM34_15450 [Verrucomicrobiae bacterium]|nr:hypothetical protein [Verrucomicrobiae bacterium]
MNRARPAFVLAAALLLVAGMIPLSASAATIWRFNLYRSGSYVSQDPYYTACTAAAVMTMLNITDLADTGGAGFRWTVFRTKNSPDRSVVRDMTSILWFERTHDTLASGRPGSDAHGWRNALNYYGWGWSAMTDPEMRIYDDRAYGSFDGALKAAVVAIARFHKPVGVLAWAGGHAQIATGYVATGEDPATSDNFVVNGLWLTDPLRSNGIVNRYINWLSLKSGDLTYRFQTYREVDSPLDDPYTVGWRRSSVRSTTSEWYRRWVLIVPIRDGLPEATPTPTPTPSPTPTPTPTPPADTPPPDPSPSSAPDSTPESTPSSTPDPLASASSTQDPSASPSPALSAGPSDAPSDAVPSDGPSAAP